MPHSATRFALLATCFIAVGLHRADACKICLPMPQTTAADLLIESDVVVFAREDPDKPFSYQAVDVIKGDLDSTAIDLFVDSSTRRRLEVTETLVVVLARDRKDQSWRTVGIADGMYQQVVRRILAVAQDWSGPNGAEKRCEFFLTL